MNEAEVRELIAGGESLLVEFKEQIDEEGVFRAVACLANRQDPRPAHLIIGVSDDGRIVGCPWEGNIVGRMKAKILHKISPHLQVQVHQLSIEGKAIVVIEVPQPPSPCHVKGRYIGRRLGGDGKPQCAALDVEEIVSLRSALTRSDYSTEHVIGARWEDLDPIEFERYRRFVRSVGRADQSLLELDDRQLAEVLGGLEPSTGGDQDRITVLGLLLFGREDRLVKLLPAHEVAFQVLEGEKVRVNDHFRVPLLHLFEILEERFRARTNEIEFTYRAQRIAIPDYPPMAFREGLANALVHRDYTINRPVHIQWHEDRLEITSPGPLPRGVSLGNILAVAPSPRNPRLADALKRAGIVERTARGVDTIFREQIRTGRPAPRYDEPQRESVQLTLPGGTANLEFVRLVLEREQGNEQLKLGELMILNALQEERTIDVGRAASLVQKKAIVAKQYLNHLQELGLLESRGGPPSKEWILSRGVYEELGKLAAHGRLRALDTAQCKQMIVQHVERTGSISRSIAMSLCGIDGPRATRLLSSLVREERIKKIGGRGRGVYYILWSRA